MLTSFNANFDFHIYYHWSELYSYKILKRNYLKISSFVVERATSKIKKTTVMISSPGAAFEHAIALSPDEPCS